MYCVFHTVSKAWTTYLEDKVRTLSLAIP